MQAAIVKTMGTGDFNSEASTPRYAYRRSPVHPRGFMILKYREDLNAEPLVVGDYTVLDPREDFALSERKVINLISLLNGRRHLMELGHETNSRVLYHIVTECDDDGKARVIFYHLGKEGVSEENALLRIEKDEYVT